MNKYLMVSAGALVLLASNVEAARKAKTSIKSENKKGEKKAVADIKSEQAFSAALEKTGTYAIKFYAPWCSYCKQMEPVFEEVAEHMGGQATFMSVNTDTDDLKDVAKVLSVKNLPTTLFLTKKTGALSEEAIREEVLYMTHSQGKSAAKPSTKSSNKKETAKKYVIDIKSEKEFSDKLAKDGVFVIKFYAPWCSFCTQMSPHFEKVAEQTSGQATFMSVNTSVAELKDIAGMFNVKGLPTTIFLTKKAGALTEEALRQEVLNALGKGHLPRAPEKAGEKEVKPAAKAKK